MAVEDTKHTMSAHPVCESFFSHKYSVLVLTLQGPIAYVSEARSLQNKASGPTHSIVCRPMRI